MNHDDMPMQVVFKTAFTGRCYKAYPCKQCNVYPIVDNDKTDYSWYWETWLQCPKCNKVAKSPGLNDWPEEVFEKWNDENRDKDADS